MDIDQNKQLARLIYHRWMSNMKFALDLEEYSYKDKGRDDPRYRFFKKQFMANTYDSLRMLFQELADMKLLIETDYHEDVKDGYKPTDSGGSGHINSDDFNKWLKKLS